MAVAMPKNNVTKVTNATTTMKDKAMNPLDFNLPQTSNGGTKSLRKKKRKTKKCPKVVKPLSRQKIRSSSAVESKSENTISNTPHHGLTSSSSSSRFCERPSTAGSLRLPSIHTPMSTSSTALSASIDRLATPPGRQRASLPESSQPTSSERRKKIPLLAAIKPANEKAEKERFLRAKCQYNPYFIYKFPADAEVLERVSVASDKFLPQAILIMERAIDQYGSYENFEADTGGQIISRGQINNLVQRYLKKEDIEKEIVVNLTEELLSRGSMTRHKGKPQLNVRVSNLREYWVEGLLRHELGTHYVRSYNNKFQPWYNWKVRKELDMLPLNPTEEGLASLHSVLFRRNPCLWRSALLYYTVYKASKLSLKDLFKDLGRFVNDQHVRWDYCIRAKRGQIDTSTPGAFSKDQVYLSGALQILKYRRQIDFQMMMRLGKVAYQDIDRLKGYADLEGTRVPTFMEDRATYIKHLDRIAEANGLTDQVLQNV
ncbi:putative tyrosine carboxypeptidase MATCAP2 [Ylistrum balloti]|uniref:putative tyrosine carboxypeptidase MATCAP2 n=1 Tax=Ylistrum balloti TaxID=509963 RepID=UPI002905BC7A|nr:putative tyrosine carboxypeptidase MATCAP2 [Ylistrum balloti]